MKKRHVAYGMWHVGRLTFALFFLLVCLFTMQAHAKKKITKPTDRAVYHNNQGVSYLNKNDLERSEFELKTAIELAPEYVEAFNNLGTVYKLKGDLPAAAAQFRRAIDLDKDYASAYSNLGAVYLAQGNVDGAINTIKKGLKKDGTIADAHYNLGLAYLEKTKTDKSKSYIGMAEAEFIKATELNPNLVHVHKTLAQVYKSTGDYDLAIIRYRLALGNEPANADLWNQLGQVYLEKGDQFQAENCFQKAVELGAAQPKPGQESGMEMGLFYIKEKRYQDAANEFKAIIEKNPLNDQAWYRMGTAYLFWGDDERAKKNNSEATRLYNEAVAALKKAKEVNPQSADAAYNLGLTYLKQGKTLEAQKEWEYTVTISPKHARALYNLGLLYQKMGRTDDGFNMLCRFTSVAGNQYPVELSAARQAIEVSKFKCQN